MINTKALGRSMVRGTPQGLFLTLYKNITFVVYCSSDWIRWPVLRSKTVRMQPVFDLVAAKCHRHLAFKWIQILSQVKK